MDFVPKSHSHQDVSVDKYRKWKEELHNQRDDAEHVCRQTTRPEVELVADTICETRRGYTMQHVVHRPDTPHNDHRYGNLAWRRPRVVSYRVHDGHVPLQRQQHKVVGGRQEQRPDDVSADPEPTIQLIGETRKSPDAGVHG